MTAASAATAAPVDWTIALTEGKARVKLADGKVFEAPNKAGDVFWEEASTHTVENVGGRNMRAYMVELKGRDYQPSTG